MLKDYPFKNIYNSKQDDLISEFYIPALKNSIVYNRVSAYFDSKILRMYSAGIENIVESNGKINFVFSCDISDEDYDLMKKGYKLREEIECKLLNKLDDEDINIDFYFNN